MSEAPPSGDGNPSEARSAGRTYNLWAGLSLGFVLLFLWSFPLLPATDLPQHVGIASILWRLATGDPAVASYYAFNPQPTPYYLAYVLLSPCVGLFGALTGARIALSILAIGWVGAFQLCAREVRAPAVVLAGAAFTFFSTMFYWGFVATQVGVPFFLLALWTLLRYPRTRSRRDLWLGSIAALLATLSHALLFLPTAVVVIAFWLGNHRRHLRECLVIGAAAALPLAPWALSAVFAPPSLVPIVVNHSKPALWLHYLHHHIGPIEQGARWWAHPLCLAGVAILGLAGAFRATRAMPPAPRSKRSRRARRNRPVRPDLPRAPPCRSRVFLVVALVGLTLLFLSFPRRVEHGSTFVWNVAPRFLVFVELLLWLLVPAWRSRLTAGISTACVIFALALQGFAQWHLWRDFNDAAGPEMALVRKVPRDGRLQAAFRTDQRFQGFWPAFLDHIPMYHVANGGLLVTNLWKTMHMPVVQRCRQAATGGQPVTCDLTPNYLLTSKSQRLPPALESSARLLAEDATYALYSLHAGYR